MPEAHTFLVPWESFYVIVGSSGAALTGLQFVVVALITESTRRSTSRELAAFGTPTVQKRFDDFGMEAMPGTPAQFAALSRAESRRWGPIIKQAGIKLD